MLISNTSVCDDASTAIQKILQCEQLMCILTVDNRMLRLMCLYRVPCNLRYNKEHSKNKGTR